MWNAVDTLSAAMIATVAWSGVSHPELSAQMGPNPYRPVDGLASRGGGNLIGQAWASFPDGREMGSLGSVHVDLDGEHVWAVVRCGDDGTPRGEQTYCDESDLDPIVRFDPDGNAVTLLGSEMFVWPHGLHIDADGNIWVTESGTGARLETASRLREGEAFGHQVFKFSPEGELLMTLGEAGVEGDGPYQFTAPSDVVTNSDGEIFVADGHNVGGNNRVVKFASDGTFIKEFGGTGYGPGELRGPHGIALDPRSGRIFVADRGNNRIQIFDQEGKFLATWTQFGKPSGIWIDDHGKIYVADSESDMESNPGWEKGIRIGEVETGWVQYFILDPGDNPHYSTGSGAEFVTVDRHGNIFAGEPRPQRLQKYVRVRP